jgi:hypothetical protein
MTVTQHVARYGGARLSRRLSRSMPIIGAAIAVVTVAATMKRKGFFRGALDTGLNVTPFVGAVKNAVELIRGRDFIPDRGAPARPTPARYTARPATAPYR